MSQSNGHPSAAQLTAWAFGELSPAETARLGEHFASCPACRSLAADLRNFDQPAAEDEEEWSAGDQKAAFGKLQERILVEDLARERVRDGGRAIPFPFVDERPTRPAAPPAARQRGALWATAAAVAAAAIAASLGVLLLRQRGELATLSSQVSSLSSEVAGLEAQLEKPVANTAFIEVAAEGNPLRGSGEPAPPSRHQGILVVIPSEEAFDEGPWRATVEDREGRVLAVLEDLRPIEGRLQFFLPPQSLPSGVNRVILYRRDVRWPRAYALPVADG